MEAEYRLLGIDAGGSKTTACLALYRPDSGVLEDAVQQLSYAESGAGNVRAAGFDMAMKNVRTAMMEALGLSGRTLADVDAVCVGMAGAGRTEEQRQVKQWLESHLDEHARKTSGETSEIVQEKGVKRKSCAVVGDAPLVLAAAAGNCTAEQVRVLEGVAVISGTGSMAWGRDRTGNEQRCGGWGYLLGDEGSGYWLALEGLRAACRAADGSASRTALLPAFLEKLQLGQPSDLIGMIYDLSRSEERREGKSV